MVRSHARTSLSSAVTFALAGLSLLAVSGCKKNPNTVAIDSSDPAAANMAMVPAGQQANYTTPAYNGNTQTYNNGQPTRVLGQNETYQGSAQGSEYPADAQYTEGTYEDQGNPQAYAGTYATQPPPAIPQYQQPPAPQANSIWTPGYWAYNTRGYYWVPGAWVTAPYQGALWTPPYWQNVSGRYRFHPGYWGRHVGFYGGVSYGNGYPGRGYYGGYWNGPNFYYNRTVTSVGPGIGFVYTHGVPNYGYGSYGYNGVGGVNLLPIAAELFAMHERHQHPLRMQYESVYRAGIDPGQFYGGERGRVGIYSASGIYAADRWTGAGEGFRGGDWDRREHHDNGNHFGEYRQLGIDAGRHEGKPEWHGGGDFHGGDFHGGDHGDHGGGDRGDHGDHGDHGGGHGEGHGHGH